jgi:hypothetical protein
MPRLDRNADAPVDLMEIESAQLTTCDVTRDGEVVRLKFIDTAGNAVVLKLPFAQAGSLTMTLPHLLTKALKARRAKKGPVSSFPSANGCSRASPTAVR